MMLLFVMFFLIGMLFAIPAIWSTLKTELGNRSDCYLRILLLLVGSGMCGYLFWLLMGGNQVWWECFAVGFVHGLGFMLCYHGYIHYRLKLMERAASSPDVGKVYDK